MFLYMRTIDDVLKISLKTFSEEKGNLVPIESDGLMNIKRVFYVYNTPKNETRGKHSHHKTKQLLICLQGSCEVICDDGKDKVTHTLDKPNVGVFIPEGIWAEETYHTEDTILMVLCDTKYEYSDYIFDYDDFLESRK